jgi:hypothetical protein
MCSYYGDLKMKTDFDDETTTKKNVVKPKKSPSLFSDGIEGFIRDYYLKMHPESKDVRICPVKHEWGNCYRINIYGDTQDHFIKGKKLLVSYFIEVKEKGKSWEIVDRTIVEEEKIKVF